MSPTEVADHCDESNISTIGRSAGDGAMHGTGSGAGGGDNNATVEPSQPQQQQPQSPLPPWHIPQPAQITYDPGLYMMNSLTRRKEHFITQTGSRQLTWYMCGPTVYDASHMGHARTYLSFDIIRRILQEYFQYQVVLIENVTDIDDKIIVRSREQGISHDQLSRKWEESFHQDMAQLGVMPPTIITRVTEYLDDIVQYIQRIMDKQLAYASNGSVYFDVSAFVSTPGMHYCKLAPEQVDNSDLLAEGEGKLSQDYAQEKHSPRDFALWKKSKPGEPEWESPWGLGRPGWHIECSVMAADMLQQLTGSPTMDMHSGGIDLKFPHHDNEMAQAEAECGLSQWVNYFVHSGHLHIKGLKMSKSLKNFITIQQALQIHTARQIRLLFLLYKYNAQMDYGDNTMAHALDMERRFVEFFHNVKACLRAHDLKQPQRWDAAAFQLQAQLTEAMVKVDEALKDDFDTPTVTMILADLVKATNVYMERSSGDSTPVLGVLVRNVATYITRIFRIFGLIQDDTIGFSAAATTTATTTSEASREQILEPVLDALMEFRSSVRDKARGKDLAGVLEQCDDFRDKQLPLLGIRLEDKGESKSVWKLADPAELMREIQQKQAEQERRAEEQAQRAAEEAKKEAMNKLSPLQYMQQLVLEDGVTRMYTQFDNEGMPTHDSAGEPLNKNQSKKAQKLFKTQQARYEKYLKSTNTTAAPVPDSSS